MKPQKYIQNFKCDCFQPDNYCSCPNKIIGSDTLIESVNDVAAAVIEVMTMCGIHLDKAKACHDVIIYYLLHFEEIRHRIDSIPRKRLAKEGLINDLSRKCKMNRKDTQMTYSIIKRVFKAFYYGSDEGGVPNLQLSRKLAHSPECLWVHAAQRTAQIYAAYEGIFFACQKDFECKIKIIYKQLYDRISSRTVGDDNNECICMKCLKRITAETLRSSRVTTHMHGREDPYEAMFLKELDEVTRMHGYNDDQTEDQTEEPNNVFQKATHASRCSCPSLKLSEHDNAYRTIAESVNNDCSQGPFNCRWLSISKEEYEADDAQPDIKLPEEIACSPCYYMDAECEPDCRCSCEECTCQTDENYFCNDTDASFEDDLLGELNEDLDYEEDVEDTSSKTTTATQSIAPRKIIMSAKCSPREPKRYQSKCSTKLPSISVYSENYEASLQEPEYQQRNKSFISEEKRKTINLNQTEMKRKTEILNQNELDEDVNANGEGDVPAHKNASSRRDDEYTEGTILTLLWT